jgi:hypothetical protein
VCRLVIALEGGFMLRWIFFILVLSMSSLCHAHSKKSHRNHEAHVHGAGKLDLVFDQLQGKVSFKSAAESVLGFEHTPKSQKELKAVSDAEVIFKNEITQMIQIPAEQGCVFTATQVGRVTDAGKGDEHDHSHKKNHDHKHGEHSDFVAMYDVKCQKAVEGAKITFDFRRFKRLKDLDITLVAGSIQKSAELKRKPLTVEVK